MRIGRRREPWSERRRLSDAGKPGDRWPGSRFSLRRPDDPRPDNLRLLLVVAGVAALAVLAGRLPTLLRPPPKVDYLDLPRRWSLYLPAADGARLATEVFLPGTIRADHRAGTVLRLTRAWRVAEVAGDGPAAEVAPPEAGPLNGQGLVLVVVDARGSGASSGRREAELSLHDRSDLRAVIDWIVAQPWSNGRVGLYGDGWDGQVAALAGALGHPAVRAAVPHFSHWDPLFERYRPGGLVAEGYLAEATRAQAELDAGRVERRAADGSVTVLQPLRVATDSDGRLLAGAVAEHAANADLADQVRRVEYRDSAQMAEWFGRESPLALKLQTARAAVPTYLWAGWFDAATALAAVRRFESQPGPLQVVIGPWGHGGERALDPLLPGERIDQGELGDAAAASADFLHGLLHIDPSAPPYEPGRWLKYYVLGTQSWRLTDHWPPKAVYQREWYFAPNGELSREPPREPEASDAYTVTPAATSGQTNRWLGGLPGRNVAYPDRREADRRLLTYTSRPLVQDLEFEGHPVLHLELSSDVEDVGLIVYLEAVRQDGYVAYLTEGVFRARHRVYATDPAPYPVHGPYHSFRRGESKALTPGVPAQIGFELMPIAAVIPAGWYLRVAIAGADAGTFEQVPADRAANLTVFRDALRASRLTLPEVP